MVYSVTNRAGRQLTSIKNAMSLGDALFELRMRIESQGFRASGVFCAPTAYLIVSKPSHIGTDKLYVKEVK